MSSSKSQSSNFINWIKNRKTQPKPLTLTLTIAVPYKLNPINDTMNDENIAPWGQPSPKQQHLRPFTSHLSPLRSNTTRDSPFRQRSKLGQINPSVTATDPPPSASTAAAALPLPAAASKYALMEQTDAEEREPTIKVPPPPLPPTLVHMHREEAKPLEHMAFEEMYNYNGEEIIQMKHDRQLDPANTEEKVETTHGIVETKQHQAMPHKTTETFTHPPDPPDPPDPDPDPDPDNVHPTNLRRNCASYTTAAATHTKAAAHATATHVLTCTHCLFQQCQTVKCRVPYFCLVCCPASVLFFCISEDPPVVLPVDDWIEKDNQRTMYCKPARRFIKEVRHSISAWCQQTCCSSGGNLVDVEEQTKEEIAYANEKLHKLEVKKKKRLTRIGNMMDKAEAEAFSKAAAAAFENGVDLAHPLESNFQPMVHRASPVRSSRTMMSALDKITMAKKQGQKKKQVVQGDRFGMVQKALDTACYTVDGKRFFRSKRRLDRHFHDNQLEDKADVKKRKKKRKALTVMQSNVPLEQRNVHELYKERYPPPVVVEKKVQEKKRVYDSEQNNALQKLKKKDDDEEGEENAANAGGVRPKNSVYMDLNEQRVVTFTKALLIYDELFQPEMLWNYLDTYTTIGESWCFWLHVFNTH